MKMKGQQRDVNFLDFVDLWVCDEYNKQIHVNDE
jgi:hypothetical protein